MPRPPKEAKIQRSKYQRSKDPKKQIFASLDLCFFASLGAAKKRQADAPAVFVACPTYCQIPCAQANQPTDFHSPAQNRSFTLVKHECRNPQRDELILQNRRRGGYHISGLFYVASTEFQYQAEVRYGMAQVHFLQGTTVVVSVTDIIL